MRAHQGLRWTTLTAAVAFAVETHAADFEWASAPEAENIEVRGDGLFYRQLIPPEMVPTEGVSHHGVTWHYVGQAVYETGPSRAEPTWVAETGYQAPLVDRILRTQRVDQHGRLWEVTDVDVDALQSAVQAYDSNGAGPDDDNNILEDPFAEPAGSAPDQVMEGMWIPQAWYEDQCATDDIHRWNNDGRSVVVGLNDRRKGAVVIYTRYFDPFQGWSSWDSVCSGVMVDEEWVLTAAHCVTYASSGNPMSAQAVGVCSRGNSYDDSECQGTMEFIEPSPDWEGTSSGSGADYALVKLLNPWNSPNPPYQLSSVSDLTTIDPHANLAYPAYAPGCGDPSATPNNGSFAGMYMYEQVGSVVASTSTLWRSRHDGGGRHSGSPIFYCPFGDNDGLCEAGEVAYVTGVWSGWYTDFLFTHGFRGPKAQVFRSWAIGVID